MTEKRIRKPKAKAEAKPPAAPSFTPNRAFPVNVDKDATQATNAQSVAAQILAPEAAAYRVIRAAEGNGIFSEMIDTVGVLDHMRAVQAAVNGGDLSAAEAMLIAQATSLQSLSVRLLEKATMQDWMPQFETYMRLGLKAQAQSRLALEALAAVRHGPAVFAKQANVSNGGPQQINNGFCPSPLPPLEPCAPVPFEIPQSRLLALHGGATVDTATAATAGGSDPALGTMEAVHRPDNRRRQAAGKSKPR